ncbi:MAG: DUF1572 family protein [Acidobacteriia bacterium]|nr:DUF1572 family protein [Terriglobia bacterium]
MTDQSDFLAVTINEFRKLKTLAEKALAQVDDARFFTTLDPESNSLALIVKHIAGNMRSRWTGFLTSDGEKPDRHRDSEFLHEGESRADIMAMWENGWKLLFEALTPLKPADLSRTVMIRDEPHSVLKAIQRQLGHYCMHVGQIVFLAKHLTADHWKSLSVPRGQSEQVNLRMMKRSESNK